MASMRRCRAGELESGLGRGLTAENLTAENAKFGEILVRRRRCGRFAGSGSLSWECLHLFGGWQVLAPQRRFKLIRCEDYNYQGTETAAGRWWLLAMKKATSRIMAPNKMVKALTPAMMAGMAQRSQKPYNSAWSGSSGL